MLNLDTFLYLGSILLQVAALIFALRTMRTASFRAPWALLAAALTLMTVFRVVGFATSGAWPGLKLSIDQFSLFSSAVSLLISALLMLSLLSLRRLSRREREEATARRHTEQRLASVVEHLPSPLFIKDPAGRYVLFNSTFLKYAGLPAEAVINHDDTSLFPPDVAMRFRAQDVQVLATRAPVTHEDAFDYQGTSFIFLTTKFPIWDADGGVVGIGGIAIDVTERKRAAAAVLESERRFRLALDAAEMASWEWDVRRKRTLWSGHAEAIFGLPESDEWRDSAIFEELIHPDDRARVWATVERAFRERVTYDCEFRIVRRDGQTRWLQNRAQVFYDDAGEVLRMVGIMLDVTARKDADAELRRSMEAERLARAEAESANQAKDAFLSTLSHELRTPLNAIVGWLHILKIGVTDAREHAEAVQKIEQNAEAQRQLIEDILDVSRIVHGKLRVDLKLVDAAEVVRAAVDANRPTVNARGIRLTLDVPAEGVATLVRGDFQRLQQVVWNLLSNALKFTAEAGEVVVAVRRDGSSVRVSVSDNGRGIDPAFLPHVFERFRQADSSSTRQSTGLGLGLAIARHVVELHGGQLVGESEGLDRGATFTMTLPAAEVRPGEAYVPGRRGTRGSAAVSGAAAPDALAVLEGVHVLVVDDNAASRDVVCRALGRCGARVEAVCSAAEAFEAVQRQPPPQVLLSDIAMPDEDGFSLLRRIRALPGGAGRVPAIAMTAYASEDDRRLATEVGFDVHVAKPVDPGELMRVIARLAKGRGGDADGEVSAA